MTTAVLDVGKTHVRLNVVEESGAVTAFARRANHVESSGPYPHFDVDALHQWLIASLEALQRQRGLRRLICTTHGASGALLRGRELALPVMDYEWQGPGGSEQEYEHARDAFARSLSPSLPTGLNLARQLWWQSRIAPEEFAASDTFVPYPQYWAWRLCGVAAAEISSLGSHTDLWRPLEARPSSLAQQFGIARRLPPIRGAGEVLGRWAGPQAAVDVHCGVHDSSAAYIAQYPRRGAPGVVVSTGTWIVCMAPAGDVSLLDPARDVSGTVSVHGAPLACARFMGGREFAVLAGEAGLGAQGSVRELQSLLRSGSFALPAFAAAGPFQCAAQRGSVHGPQPASPSARNVLAALYCALVTDVCLEQIGARGSVVVEGPFASNAIYLGALAALRDPDTVAASQVSDGPSIGAAMIAVGSETAVPRHDPSAPLLRDELLAYRDRWRALLLSRGVADRGCNEASRKTEQ